MDPCGEGDFMWDFFVWFFGKKLRKEPVFFQGSLNDLFWRDETMQIYGKSEGIPL